MDDTLIYKIALSLVPGIGGKLARSLVDNIGSVEGIFSESITSLKKIHGIGDVIAKNVREKSIMEQAETELKFIEKYSVNSLFYTDPDYPSRLTNCVDAPILIFTMGNMNLNEERLVSIVGTRNSTHYGRQVVEDLIGEFSKRNYKIVVVSGLAYGIDILAHKTALKHQIPTVGVVGHGLDCLYPSLHKSTAKQMLESGGLVTDFPSKTKIDPPNFIKRNRIIAGLTDATIVVESAQKGGALITADISSSYNRDVFAFPGRAGDIYSSGCNKLIRNNEATLITGIDDLEYFMGWENQQEHKPTQTELFAELEPEEQRVVNLFEGTDLLFIDQIASEMDMPVSQISAILLQLEFKNRIVSLPGKTYRLR